MNSYSVGSNNKIAFLSRGIHQEEEQILFERESCTSGLAGTDSQETFFLQKGFQNFLGRNRNFNL